MAFPSAKPEGKRPLGRPEMRWKDNIEMYLREIVCDDVDWINLRRGPVVGLMNSVKPSVTIKVGKFLVLAEWLLATVLHGVGWLWF
jgi:hypothetical protein